MNNFAAMIAAVETSNKTTVKRQALVDYFSTAPERDKLWAIRLLTGKRPKRPVSTTLLRQWCLEITGLPEWLFSESYHAVGDLAETISLVLPDASFQLHKTLSDWMDEIVCLHESDEQYKKDYVLKAWSGLSQKECFIFNKLLGGSFRIGVSKKGLVNALAQYSGQPPEKLMHALSGSWTMQDMTFDRLIRGDHINYDASKPYPFCLAHPLDKALEDLGDPHDWQAEYKWDGIRGQLIKRAGDVFIWSRGEELVSAQFPELIEACQAAPSDFVLDGEILAISDGDILNFAALQRRINRKTVSKKWRQDVPVHFYAYDCLEFAGKDYREAPLATRNEVLTSVLAGLDQSRIHRSEVISFSHWQDLHAARAQARAKKSEGLMLKKIQSHYYAGRKKGEWWKWKVDPLTIDAVMIYAQRGSGRRSGHYTDYTFAVRDGEALVTIAKAYSGLSNAEIVEVSRFVRQHSLEKFGPVRTVEPELVFEIAFEGIALSKRHKSGVALRFPRISRWRRDKTVADIDTLAQVKALIDAK